MQIQKPTELSDLKLFSIESIVRQKEGTQKVKQQCFPSRLGVLLLQ